MEEVEGLGRKDDPGMLLVLEKELEREGGKRAVKFDRDPPFPDNDDGNYDNIK
jgi:hypothetical protein